MDFPLGEGVKIVARHPVGLFALEKREGLLSHPNTGRDLGRSLLRARYDEREQCYEFDSGGEIRRLWLLNRLDSATSGVLLLADNLEVAAEVRRLFAADLVEKKYFALVFGKLSPPRQVWRDRLQVSRSGGRLRTRSEGGEFAETEARLVRFYPGRLPVSLLELFPKTGRTHQLRVQAAGRKVPIIGDQTYGDFGWNREFAKATGRRRLFLHSAEVGLRMNLGGEAVRFFARVALPDEFTP